MRKGKASSEPKNVSWPWTANANVPLPKSWASTYSPSPPKLRIHADGITVTYIGPGKNDVDAAAVRSNQPIPASCGVYYFEVTVESKGRDGYIGIGVSGSKVSLDRLPGWEKDSYGYHGDDGHLFHAHGTGTAYGPIFTEGDVVGCCVNYVERTIFFTKNGSNLGIAFTNVPPTVLYPTIGMRTEGERVKTNFGTEPFMFEISWYAKEVFARAKSAVFKSPLPPPHDLAGPQRTECAEDTDAAWGEALGAVVFEYLLHAGYLDTAEALQATSSGLHANESSETMRIRRDINKAITDGNMAESICLLHNNFPSVVKSNPALLLHMRRQHFVELVREGRAHTSDQKGLAAVFNLGQELRMLSISPEISDSDRMLVEQTFGLLAYTDPACSPVAHLLDPAERSRLAAVVNGAVLGSLGLARHPALEVLARQAALCVDIGGSAALSMADIYDWH